MGEVIALALAIVFVLTIAYWLVTKVTGWGGFT
jgi:hypothetical protein